MPIFRVIVLAPLYPGVTVYKMVDLVAWAATDVYKTAKKMSYEL